MACFCDAQIPKASSDAPDQCGVRIAAPGKCKDHDPVSGQDPLDSEGNPVAAAAKKGK